MSVPESILGSDPGLDEWAILAGYRGSVAHGTYLPTDDPASVDDKDLMAFCVPPPSHFIGLDVYGSRGTKEIVRDIEGPPETRWDVVIYEIRKALGLLAKGNPNVLSMLWLPETLYTKRTEAGRILIASRDFFSAKSVYHAYVGYARGQAVKMERGVHEGYMGARRKALVEQHGFDIKNAAHLIRLLRQGVAFLSTGELVVQRPDAAELLAIRRGEWSIEKVKSEADGLFEAAREALVRSPLPAAVDRGAVSELCERIVAVAWEERGDLPAEFASRWAGPPDLSLPEAERIVEKIRTTR